MQVCFVSEGQDGPVHIGQLDLLIYCQLGFDEEDRSQSGFLPTNVCLSQSGLTQFQHHLIVSKCGIPTPHPPCACSCCRIWTYQLGGARGEEPACQCRRCRRLGLGRSPEGGHGNPPQYSCLENPMERGAWQATVHGAAELDTTEELTLSLSF